MNMSWGDIYCMISLVISSSVLVGVIMYFFISRDIQAILNIRDGESDNIRIQVSVLNMLLKSVLRKQLNRYTIPLILLNVHVQHNHDCTPD